MVVFRGETSIREMAGESRYWRAQARLHHYNASWCRKQGFTPAAAFHINWTERYARKALATLGLMLEISKETA